MGPHCGSAYLGSISSSVCFLSPAAVLHRKENPYGAEVLVLREAVPADWKISPVSIEELFVFMVKEAK